jgi:hypothetical protein
MKDLLNEWNTEDDVYLASERLWTSMTQLEDEEGGQFEFCFIFSQAIIEDRNSIVRACAILASGLKANLVAARSDGTIAFPTNGECWRGGSFNMQHKDWFDSMVGKKYRIPAFLATSVKQTVTDTCMGMAEGEGFPVVQWKIQRDKRGDPAGDNDPRYTCKHVNLLREPAPRDARAGRGGVPVPGLLCVHGEGGGVGEERPCYYC